MDLLFLESDLYINQLRPSSLPLQELAEVRDARFVLVDCAARSLHSEATRDIPMIRQTLDKDHQRVVAEPAGQSMRLDPVSLPARSESRWFYKLDLIKVRSISHNHL